MPHELCGLSTADQVRALGLVVGDTIEGTERGVTWWATSRLTLLWVGETVAVWREVSRSSTLPEWSEPEESANWTLECRDWQKMPGADRGAAR